MYRAARSARKGSAVIRRRRVEEPGTPQPGIAGSFLFRRAARAPETGGGRRPPWVECLASRDLFSDSGDSRQQLGHGARGRGRRGARKRGALAGRGHIARSGAQHQTESALRSQFRVLFGGSLSLREARGGLCARYPARRRARLREALRRELTGIPAHDTERRGRRESAPGDLPDRL